MKKLLDSKFLFILALSIVVLIVLGIGAFYLFDNSDDVFVKDGYILNPLSAKNEKYLFDKNTSYHENLSSMVVFNDTDDKEVSVFKDSFLHYMDSSMSFLTNGAILDLGSIGEGDAVRFYNITSKSIISRSGDGYVIETNGEDINLKNFMGRISDKKFIVAGTLEAKIPGNEKNISGNYFEVVYNEEGVVTIENNEVKYQVAAEGSYIYAGDIIIDLGNKKIVKGDEDIMSITAITINGDENIEIMPKTIKEDDDNSNNGNEGNGNGNGDGDDNGDDNGNGGANDQQEDIKIEGLLVSLKDYEIYSTKIAVVFDIINKREDDSLILKVTDLDSGKTIDRVYDVLENQEIRVSKMAPNTNYLFTVINERDGNKYFQKILKTKDFGINLEQTYITSNELGYKITVDEGSELGDIDITLKRFNENSNEYEDVESRKLSDYGDTITGSHSGINFTDLDSDTIYTLALDGFVINSIKTEKIYNVTMTSLTLKETPTFGAVSKEIKDDAFKLFIDNVQDKDSAIESYTYYIFDNANDADIADFEFDPDKALLKKTRTTADPLELKIGEEGIESNHNYLYMVAVEYYDNEKYFEYVIPGRIDLFIGNDPFVTIQKNDDEISYDEIGATITITDNSCLIAMKDRTCYNDYEDNPIVIDIKEKDGKGNLIKLDDYPMNVSDFEVIGNTLRKNLHVTGLKEGTTYVISVSAARKDKPEDGIKPLKEGAVYENEITTKYLASFKVEWKEKASTEENPINGTFQLKENKNDYSISGDIAAGLVERVIFRLYDDPFANNLAQQTLLASSVTFVNTEEATLKEMFYDGAFDINQKLFGIDDISALRTLTREKTGREDNKLSTFYTVVAEVYYANDAKVTLAPQQYSFPIAAYLCSDVEEPMLTKEEIWKSRNDNFNSKLTSGEGGTVVGYQLHVSYDKAGYDNSRMSINNIKIYVYNEEGQKVEFYTDDNGNHTNVFTIQGNDLTGSSFDANIYMGDGVINGSDDNTFMTRGRKYHANVEINYQTSDGKSERQTSDSIILLAKKERPKMLKLYVAETTKTGDITYKYQIEDVDNAWHSEDNEYNIYYVIGEGEKAKIPVVRNLEELNTFKISGLNNGDGYTLSYKRDDYDTGDSETDTVEAAIGSENRLYDGYYDASDGRYNFKYKVINDPLHDNKVTIKILASDDILDKILIYKVKFTDDKGNVYEVPNDIWNLEKCEDAGENDKNRCFQVEYTKLKAKNMKSGGDEKNYITTSIDAIYDNGLTGFDYIDKVGESKEYPYMIMQDDSTLEKLGTYFIVNNRTLYNVSPVGNRIMPLGYYNFSYKYGGIEYKSFYNTNDIFNITYTVDERGYYVSGAGSLNPKMVSVNTMNGVDNQFYFSSITPMIKIDKTISLINGAQIMMSLSGADIDDFCADNNQATCARSGDKYLYVQTLTEDMLDTVNANEILSEPLIPTVKVALDNSEINGQYIANVLNLAHDSEYYYRVYAYLNDGGNKKLTQIFDSTSKNKPETYTFSSKKLTGKDGILENTSVIYQPTTDGEYNDKELVTTINLNNYDSEVNIPYNFNVSYEFCKQSDCSVEGSKLFNKEIETTTKTITSKQNITSYDLEYGKDYYMYLYMSYDYYDRTSGEVIKRTVPVYAEAEEAVVNVALLKTPTFVVTRWADYIVDSNDYVINLKVTVNDDDQVLNSSKFYVKLVKSNDETGTVRGKLFLQNDGGIFTQVGNEGTYNEHIFMSDERSTNNYQNKTIRIGGLEPDTKYTLIVYGEAHINNSNLDSSEVTIVSGKDGTGDPIWSSNNYGLAFGKEITYRAMERGFVVRYPGGSNLDELHISAVTVDVKDYNGRPFYHETITIGSENKYFTVNKDGKYRFVIEYQDEGKKNERDETYLVKTTYDVYDPRTNSIVTLDETYNSSFEQPVTYDPDLIEDDE